MSTSNNQTTAKGGQVTSFMSTSRQANHQSPNYNPMITDVDNGRTESTTAPSAGSVASFDPSSTSPTDISLTQPPILSPFAQGKRLIPHPPPDSGNGGKDSHETKRVKTDLESDTPNLDSIDYWINFDDDDVDNWGSFEIDFSKLNDGPQNRSINRQNQVPGLGTGLYTSASMPSIQDDLVDDVAFDNSLSEDEDNYEAMDLEAQLAKSDMPPPAEIPPREGLYSTPLSWERPQLGLREDTAPTETRRQTSDPADYPLPEPGTLTLSPAERRRLIAIAMNVSQAPASFMPPTGFGLGFGAGLGFDQTSPDDEGTSTHSLPGLPHRKGSSQSAATMSDSQSCKGKHPAKKPQIQRQPSATTEKVKEKGKSADRLAHNDIERKYRTNLKDKIAELRDAVPSLRGSETEGEDNSASQGGPKLSKGTILMKATEYIHQLEGRNKSIIKEQQQLARRLQAFETLLNATATQSIALPKHSGSIFDPRGFC
ncbi:hypothetical protein S40293_03160 [Stachybotrys chartarum IBT 40293]|nr:hypothetical protein S40293_03160 [Stachybotrys chartarum IBT 40293]